MSSMEIPVACCRLDTSVGSSPVFVSDQNDREPIPVRIICSSSYSAMTRLLLPCPNQHQLNNDQSNRIGIGVQSILSRIKFQFRLEWSSWIRIRLRIHNSRPGRSPTLLVQRDNQPSIASAIAIAIEPQLCSREATSINLYATLVYFPLHWGSISIVKSNKELNQYFSLSSDRRRDGLTRYIVLRSAIALSVWPYHNLEKQWCFPYRC